MHGCTYIHMYTHGHCRVYCMCIVIHIMHMFIVCSYVRLVRILYVHVRTYICLQWRVGIYIMVTQGGN